MNPRFTLFLVASLAACISVSAAALDDARALVHAGKLDEAISKLEIALRGGSDKAAIAVELARTQIAAGRLISARQTVEKFLLDTPADPQRNAMMLLNARLREANGNLPEALSLYRTIAEQTPAVPERADALAGAVSVAGLLNNATMVERCLSEFTESFPQDPREREFLLRLYRQRASLNNQAGAADAAHRFKTLFPKDPAGAAFMEFYHRSVAGDVKGAIAAFQFERKLPTFTLSFGFAGPALEMLRRDPSGYALIEPLATEFATLTGDPQFQLSTIEWLPALNMADKAVELGNRILPKLTDTAWGPRLRFALATALAAAKNGDEAEKQLTALLAANPANDAAWNLYWGIVSTAKRPEAHEKLLEQALASLPAQKNLTLRITAQSVISSQLVQLAWNRHDYAGAEKLAGTFLETDGLSPSGPQIINIAATICITGLPEAMKAKEDADALLKVATANQAKASGPALTAAKDALDKAQAASVTAQKSFDDARANSIAKFDALLPKLEKYLARTAAWGPSLDSIDAIFKPGLALSPMADEAKKFKEMVQRVKQSEPVRSELEFQHERVTGHWPQASTLGETLLPKLLEIGGSLGFEVGSDIVATIFQAQQWDKTIAASKLYLAKYPGATGPLLYLAAATQLIGAPKNHELPALVDDIVAKAGGSYWPYEVRQIRDYTFTIAEQNRLGAEMQVQLKLLTSSYPGMYDVYEYQRRIGAVYAGTGDLDAAKQVFLASEKAAEPTGSEPAVLYTIATSFTAGADWILPLLDGYLARPSRGPQQGGIQLLRGYLLFTQKKDTAGAIKSIQIAAARPTDLAWTVGSIPTPWADALNQTATSAKVEDVKPEEVALLKDIFTVFQQIQWLPNLMVRQAQLGQSFDFADSLSRLTAGVSPNDANTLVHYFIPVAQQLASLNQPESAGLVLRTAVNHFTGVDQAVRTQASQALFSLSNKYSLPDADIDEKLEWAPLLKAARSFRMGDPVSAWKAYTDNEALFQKHQDKLPADFLRWVSDRLLQRDDDPSRELAEKILNHWITSNETSTAVPADEKAKMQLHLADFYFKTLRYDLSRSECLSLINRFPGTPEATDAQFRIGECYLNQKMYVDAAKVFDALAKSKDKLSASRGEFLLGVLAQQRGDTDDAKARFRNVLDLAPSSEVANSILYRLSELYGDENRFSEELTLLRSIGLIGSNSKQWHSPGKPLEIVIQDADLGVSRGQSYVPVVVTTSSGDREVVRLESGAAGKGFFRAELQTTLGEPKPNDGILEVNGTDVITYDYPEEFKKQFATIAPPQSNIRLASDAEFKISATEIKDDEEISFEERLRQQRQLAGKQAGLEFRQEFRRGNDLKPGNNIYLQVKDADRDISKEADTVKVLVEASSGSRVTAELKETGAHTGIFKGFLKTQEIATNIFASDHSVNNDAVRAIDNDRKTAWEGQNDGLAPKFIAMDLKQSTKLGELKWYADSSHQDKVPTEYGIQVSTNLTDWKTVAATAKFTGATKDQIERIVTTTDGGASATAKLTGAEGRYVRILIEKFTGTAPRIAEIEVTDATGTMLVPSQREAANAGDDALRLTPSDRITATYEDETSTTSPGKPRTLAQNLQATYYNGKIDFIGYEFKAVEGQNEPVRWEKQVRRVDPGQRVIVRITDFDADVSEKRDKVNFTLKTSDGQEFKMEAIETEAFSGVFTKEFDIWSPERPNGIKLGPGVTLEANYLDEQNTIPGAPTVRTAFLEAATPGDVKIAFVESNVKEGKEGQEILQYTSVLDKDAPSIKPVAFRPPLTFEIIDPAAAKDSFSEVKATLTTSGGSSVEVICPLSGVAAGKPAQRKTRDDALESGRFVGQIFMNLGDKDSPPTMVLEPGDTRTLVARRNPAALEDQQLATVVPVLNLNGQDILTVTYKASGKEFKDQARLAVPASLEFTDNSYEKPVTSLYLGDKIFLAVHDLTADSSSEADSIEVKLTSSRGESFTAKLQETLSHSGDFTGSFLLVPNEKPTPGDDKMEAWFGDVITLAYVSKTDSTVKLEKTINVMKGTDGTMLVFEKKYATERIAIDSQFRMAESYFELFKNYRTLKQDQQATVALNEGMQLLKELSADYPSKAYEARTDYLLGQFAQELKKYDEAIGYYRRIVQNYSDHPLAPDAQYKLGQCFEEKGDMDAASAEYVTLAYTWPENPLVANVVVRIAEYFYNKKEYPTAAEVAMKFVERFPQHEWAERMLFRAAQCWFKAEKFPEAGKEFDLLVENYPRGKFRPDAIFWAGESYRSAGQMDVAFRRYKRATWDYPESDAAKFSRGKLVLPEMVGVADREGQQQ